MKNDYALGFFEAESPETQFQSLYKQLNITSLIETMPYEKRDEVLYAMLSIIEKSDNKQFVEKGLFQLQALFSHNQVPFNRCAFSRLQFTFIKHQKSLEPISLTTESERALSKCYKDVFFTYASMPHHEERSANLEALFTFAKQLANKKAYRRAFVLLNNILNFTHPDEMSPLMRRNIVRNLGIYAEKSGDAYRVEAASMKQVRLMDAFEIPFDLPCYTRAMFLLFNQAINEKAPNLDKAKACYSKLKDVLSRRGKLETPTLIGMEEKFSALEEAQLNKMVPN